MDKWLNDIMWNEWGLLGTIGTLIENRILPKIRFVGCILFGHTTNIYCDRCGLVKPGETKPDRP